MFVYVRTDRERDCLTVIKSNHEHNHEIGPSIFKHYPENRRLQPEEREELKAMVNLKVKPHIMAEKMRSSSG